MVNEPIQYMRIEESTRHNWVKQNFMTKLLKKDNVTIFWVVSSIW